ncbi:MAG: PLP-dependent transferase [Defluviitaleaceae bacterium]|nr:PLP-dependent transferase [Defluviitaleaceae bacterium]
MYKKIEKYLQQNIYPFHMPGHKRNPAFLPQNLLGLDLTEIPSMDVLSAPTDMIKELQGKIASFYGADESFLLVNGASAGVMAAVCYAGEKIVLARNAHVSAYRGLTFSGARPKYILPQIMPGGLAGGVVLENFPEGHALLVVSPTYEGFTSHIATIAKEVHAKGGILIVDEAHGAHFPFHKNFPAHALACGADIVVNSFHKTLPALSQTAVIHANRARIDIEKLRFYVNAFQTTSPSYMLMAATDFMLEKLWGESRFFDEYVSRLKRLRSELKSDVLRLTDRFPTFNMNPAPGAERCAFGEPSLFGVHDKDEGKLNFTAHTEETAEEISRLLANEYGVQMEMANGQHLLAMTSVADTDEGFDRLQLAMEDISKKLTPTRLPLDKKPMPQLEAKPILPEVLMSPREALALPSRRVSVKEAVGQVSAELVAKYPPGVAAIVPGERVMNGACENIIEMISII